MKQKLEDLWVKYIDQRPTNNELRYVIEQIEPLRIKAAQKLLLRDPNSYNIRCVIEHVESLRKEAGKKTHIAEPNQE